MLPLYRAGVGMHGINSVIKRAYICQKISPVLNHGATMYKRTISTEGEMRDFKSAWESKNLMVLYSNPPHCLRDKLTTPDEKFGSFEISRVFKYVDANPAGNVHGGTILALIEQAGAVAASRYIHADGNCATASPALIRMGHVDFIAPAYVREVGKFQAKVVFTSNRSVLVLVHVWAEDTRTNSIRLCNRAFAWFVGMGSNGDSLFDVPQLQVDRNDELSTCLYDFANDSYRRRIKSTGIPSRGSFTDTLQAGSKQKDFNDIDDTDTAGNDNDFMFPLLPMKCPPGTVNDAPIYRKVAESRALLAALVLPEDMTTGDFAAGGMIMKMIDSCAAIVAFKHCRSNVVTASLDALDFMRPIKKGNLVSLTARATYASSKSLEILVSVDVEDLISGIKQPANQAILTFVKLDEHGKVDRMPGLIIETRKEYDRMRMGHARYTQRKSMRAAQPIARP
eukprot:CFRG5616T1